MQKKISFFLFFAVLIILPLVTLLSKKEDFSETENRYLSSFPSISIRSIMNTRFMNGFETFFADHFVGRTGWIAAKSEMELATGKNELNGIFVTDDMLLERFDKPDSSIYSGSISAINSFAEEYSDSEVYLMIVPTSTAIYADRLPANAPYYDQKSFIDGVYAGLSDRVNAIDIYRTMQSHRDEYIYYRTDHHWTTLGAYYGYSAAIRRLGYTPVDYDRYDIEHAGQNFNGTFYSKTLVGGITPDTLDIYTCNDGANVTSVEITSRIDLPAESYDSMYFREYLTVKDKYSVFFGTNQPLINIKTDVENGERLLLIKDSYAHCFAPFLTQHYSEITMVDMRYINIGFSSIIDIDSYDQVLFLYNASSFAEDDNIRKILY